MQVCSHYIYRTACHQYVVACHMPPILHWTIRPSIPMERGTFTRSSAYPTSRAYPRRGRVTVYIKSLCTGGEYPSVCTDTIALFALYCQQLFLAFFGFFHLPFRDLVGGMPTLSREPVPLDRYRISQINDLVKNFFGFFYLFLTFFCLAAEMKGHAGYQLTTITPRYARRAAAA